MDEIVNEHKTAEGAKKAESSTVQGRLAERDVPVAGTGSGSQHFTPMVQHMNNGNWYRPTQMHQHRQSIKDQVVVTSKNVFRPVLGGHQQFETTLPQGKLQEGRAGYARVADGMRLSQTRMKESIANI